MAGHGGRDGAGMVLDMDLNLVMVVLEMVVLEGGGGAWFCRGKG